MQTPVWIRRMFTVDDSIVAEQFTLQEDGEQGAPSKGTKRSLRREQANYEGPNAQPADERDASDGRGDSRGGEPSLDGDSREGQRGEHGDVDDIRGDLEEYDHKFDARFRDPDDHLEPVRPIPLTEYIRSTERHAHERPAAVSSPEIPDDLNLLHQKLERSFHLPDNKDIVVREFHVGVDKQWRAIAVFVDGMAATMTINTTVLEPLMVLPQVSQHVEEILPSERMRVVVEALLPSNQVAVVDKWEDAVDGVLTGSTCVFVDGAKKAVVCETKGWEHRSVGLPQSESVVKGPHQAFTESFRANTALVRAMLRSPDLVTEMLSVGKLGKTDVAIMYVHGLTNKKLVAEVKRRIKAIDIDYLQDVGILGHFIEDNPRVWLPQSMDTERPDRVAQALTEGYVAIFAGQSSSVLVVPITFWSLMQSAEDAYLRAPFGTFLRFIRWFSVLIALLVPGLYVSVTNYHPEMIPTDLMMAIAGSREQVPFPVVLEILMMELAIELIREAGIRIPSIIGPTIGIVGALIIGQAAVQAGVVSPLLVIVIAVTALASFTIPTYNLQFGVRIMRFVFLLVASIFGFYGMALLGVALLARLTVQKSFGVPLLAPVAPKVDSARDVFTRGPSYTMNQRPLFLYPQKIWRQQPYTRPWSAMTDKAQDTINRKSEGIGGGSSGDGGKSGSKRGRRLGGRMGRK